MRLALLLHAAAATYREDLCERDTKLKTDATSKKVALVLRGEAFRGLSYGISPSVGRFRRGKTAFSCTAVSHRIQRALSASHVAHLVAPLEAAGLEVDVYLATCRTECLLFLDARRGSASGVVASRFPRRAPDARQQHQVRLRRRHVR